MILKCLIAAVVVFLMPCATFAESNPWARKLPFEQAVISYELSGVETGQEILYIRDHGNKRARYRTTSTTMFGITQKSSTVEIATPDWIYSFDLEEGTGSKSINPQKLMIEEYNKLTDAEKKKVNDNAEKMAGSVMGGLQGDMEQNVKEIFGYTCDRVTVMGSTVYTIHGTGISLSSESDLMGIKMKRIATSMKKKGADEKYFEFPQGIVPQPNPEADQMAQMMAQQSIAALKDPESFKGKGKGIMGMPAGDQPAIPEEDQIQMEEAMKAIKRLLGK